MPEKALILVEQYGSGPARVAARVGKNVDS